MGVNWPVDVSAIPNPHPPKRGCSPRTTRGAPRSPPISEKPVPRTPIDDPVKGPRQGQRHEAGSFFPIPVPDPQASPMGGR
jgi:hypothetical protein